MIPAEIDLNTVTIPLEMAEIFSELGPTHVEIGSGKGKFLLELASTRPETNFLGIERAAKYHNMVCTKVARRGLTNVRLLGTTAEDLLFRLLKPESIEALYVLFPDPWPKKRHHKRRFFTTETASSMVRALIPGGLLLVKSDHEGYAEVIREVLVKTDGLTSISVQKAFNELPLTGFESKYIREGRQIHAFASVKT